MGFIMEDEGNCWIETRREGLVLGHQAKYHKTLSHPYDYDTLEVDKTDIPDLIRALMHACLQERIEVPVVWRLDVEIHSVKAKEESG